MVPLQSCRSSSGDDLVVLATCLWPCLPWLSSLWWPRCPGYLFVTLSALAVVLVMTSFSWLLVCDPVCPGYRPCDDLDVLAICLWPCLPWLSSLWWPRFPGYLSVTLSALAIVLVMTSMSWLFVCDPVCPGCRPCDDLVFLATCLWPCLPWLSSLWWPRCPGYLSVTLSALAMVLVMTSMSWLVCDIVCPGYRPCDDLDVLATCLWSCLPWLSSLWWPLCPGYLSVTLSALAIVLVMTSMSWLIVCDLVCPGYRPCDDLDVLATCLWSCLPWLSSLWWPLCPGYLSVTLSALAIVLVMTSMSWLLVCDPVFPGCRPGDNLVVLATCLWPCLPWLSSSLWWPRCPGYLSVTLSALARSSSMWWPRPGVLLSYLSVTLSALADLVCPRPCDDLDVLATCLWPCLPWLSSLWWPRCPGSLSVILSSLAVVLVMTSLSWLLVCDPVCPGCRPGDDLYVLATCLWPCLPWPSSWWWSQSPGSYELGLQRQSPCRRTDPTPERH